MGTRNMKWKRIFFIGCVITLFFACSEEGQKTGYIRSLSDNNVALNKNHEDVSDLMKDENMDKKLLTVSAYCTNNPQCVYSGEKVVPITIEFKNHSDMDIYIPLKYVQRTGPIMRLMDKKTGRDTYLPVSLPHEELLNDLTLIPSGGKVSWEGERVGKTDLEYFGKPVDTLLEIRIPKTINAFMNGKPIDFDRTATLHIKGDY